MKAVANLTRPAGAPKVVTTGPSSLRPADRWARNLGWMSIALGAGEIMFGRRMNRSLGLPQNSSLPFVFGLREIASGVLCLSVDRRAGIWSRIAGDGLDIAVLMGAMDRRNPKRQNVKAALATVLAVAAFDVAVASRLRTKRGQPKRRSFSGRSGFPDGIEAARAAGRRRTEAEPFPITQVSSVAVASHAPQPDIDR